MNPTYKCLLLVRISTTKGARESDGPDLQLKRGLAFAEQKFNATREEVLIINEIWSGRDEERPCLEQAFDLVGTHDIKVLLVNDIDRLTRAGVSHYEILKRKFKDIDCNIYDVKGIIQPDSNTLAGSGGVFGGDFSYDWSVFATSEKAEVMEAQMAKDEARKILGRTIPAQIQNAQLGRTNRAAPYGFRNIKIIDDNGKPQASKEPCESEAFYVRRIFEGMAAGKDIRNLCDEINAQGFQTRVLRRWSADCRRVVGKKGGIALNPRLIRDIIERATYAGFVCEKWTHDLPVPANHEGLVTLDLWNQANNGKWKLMKDADSPTGWRKLSIRETKSKQPYLRVREDFPFKALIRCQHCDKPLKAGYSRSRNGNRYGYYFCSYSHKQLSQRQDALHDYLKEYLGDIQFTPEIAERFEQHLREVWIEKVGGLNRHLVSANSELANLRSETDNLFEKIKMATNPLIIARLEEEYEQSFLRIKLLESKRDEKEYSEVDMNRAIAWAKHLVEHLDELIIDTNDEALRSVFWSLVFERLPTLEELHNRTASLSPLVRLKECLKSSENVMVGQNDLNVNQILEELIRWNDTLTSLENLLPIGFTKVVNRQDNEFSKKV